MRGLHTRRPCRKTRLTSSPQRGCGKLIGSCACATGTPLPSERRSRRAQPARVGPAHCAALPFAFRRLRKRTASRRALPTRRVRLPVARRSALRAPLFVKLRSPQFAPHRPGKKYGKFAGKTPGSVGNGWETPWIKNISVRKPCGYHQGTVILFAFSSHLHRVGLHRTLDMVLTDDCEHNIMTSFIFAM